jgi:hypothetical protein
LPIETQEEQRNPVTAAGLVALTVSHIFNLTVILTDASILPIASYLLELITAK